MVAKANSQAHTSVAGNGTSPKVKLTYLDKRVKGEAIRLALVVGGIPFEDERLGYHEVAARRDSGELPFSQVPVLDIGDGHGPYAQSQALLRWAGRKGGLYPEDWQLTIDAVTEVVSELWTDIIKLGYGSAMMRNPVTAEPMVRLTQNQRMQAAQLCNEVVFPTRFGQLENLLMANCGPYFCGNQITIADLSFYALASNIQKGVWMGNGVEPQVLNHCPQLQALLKQVDEHPRVQKWYASNPPVGV